MTAPRAKTGWRREVLHGLRGSYQRQGQLSPMSTPTPSASTIMIIRHAEKPPEPPASPPPFGVTPEGRQDDHSLSVRGWQRAGALATFFSPSRTTPPSISTPQFIYAVKVDTDDGNPHDAAGVKIGSKGKRAQQTVAPVAEKLGATATLNFTFDKGEEAAMVTSAMACPGTVLICWEHHNIPHITSGMPVSPATPVPVAWPVDAQGAGRFDVVWVFAYDHTAGTYRFTPIPQMLLAGDLPS